MENAQEEPQVEEFQAAVEELKEMDAALKAAQLKVLSDAGITEEQLANMPDEEAVVYYSTIHELTNEVIFDFAGRRWIEPEVQFFNLDEICSSLEGHVPGRRGELEKIVLPLRQYGFSQQIES